MGIRMEYMRGSPTPQIWEMVAGMARSRTFWFLRQAQQMARPWNMPIMGPMPPAAMM